MLGRKAGCEGVRTDLSASLAVSRHRDIGPARFKPVDCEEARGTLSYAYMYVYHVCTAVEFYLPARSELFIAGSGSKHS
jgi:hypothetical protein